MAGEVEYVNDAFPKSCRRLAGGQLLSHATNAFRKTFENLQAAVALHFAHYNLVRLHKTLRVTSAMAATVTNRVWSLEELADRTSR